MLLISSDILQALLLWAEWLLKTYGKSPQKEGDQKESRASQELQEAQESEQH